MLIITGTGRSGTSVLARFCYDIGYNVGGRWCHSRNAGMEDLLVVQANEDITVQRELEKHAEFVKTFERDVIKDPRFIYPGVLKFWATCRKDIRLIVCLRDLDATYNSRVAMNKETQYTKSDLAIMMHQFWVDVAQLDVPVKLLHFPDFLSDYTRVFDTLDLPFDHARGLETWKALVDTSKVHW